MKTRHYLQTIPGFALLLFLLVSCSAKEQEYAVAESMAQEASSDAMQMTEVSSESDNKSALLDQPQQHVIRQAEVRFQVKDLEESTQRIEAMVEKTGAMLASSSQTQTDYAQETEFTIRVKPAQFLPLLRQLQQESVQLDLRSVSSEDVGLEYVDLQARLQAKRAVEQRYLSLLKQAKNIEEIMKVETQIQSIREEIESADARLRYLQNQTAYSTIRLTIYQPAPINMPTAPGFFYRVLEALNTGWQMLLSLVVGLFYLWPLLILGGLAVYFIRRRRRLV